MTKKQTEKKPTFYFQEVKNSYGLTEYICVLKYRDLYTSTPPKTRANLCFDLKISLKEFGEKLKK